jgi:hypothetical protein
MAEIAVPALISGVAAIGSSAIQANAQKQAAKQLQEMAPPTLSYDEALEQAQGVLNPLYDEQLEKNLQTVDRGNLSRGFYGQMPGDALKRSTALDVERARAGQIASLAQQMKGQSQLQALQLQQLAAQYALGRGQQFQNWANIALNAANSWYNMTGQVPFMGNPLAGNSGNIDPSKLTTKQTVDLITSGNWNTGASVPRVGTTSGGMTKAVQQYVQPKGINWSDPYSRFHL